MAQDAPAQNPYTRLRHQILAVLLAFGLAPLVGMGVTGFLAERGELESHARAALEAEVLGGKAAVEQFVDARLDELALVAATQPFAGLSSAQELERNLRLLQRREGGVLDLCLLDAGGRAIACAGPYGPPAAVEREALEEARVLGRHHGDVLLGGGRLPQLTLVVARPEGGSTYLLRATLDAAALATLLRRQDAGSRAELLLLDRHGNEQLASAGRPPRTFPDLVAGGPHAGVRLQEEGGDRRAFVASAWLSRDRWVVAGRRPLPGLLEHLRRHPAATLVFALGVLAIPPLSVFVANYRLRQVRALEGERAALLGSAAQTQKMATIGRLAATVAHEINNPLSVIGAQVGVLSDAIAEDSSPQARELKERLAKIEAQIERGKKVTHRLLGLARRVGPDLEPVDVQAALEEAVGFVEKASEASGTRFVRNYQLDLPLVRTSLSQMQQVFLNLINNAVDAMGGGGEVVLTIRRGEGGVVVTIADDGPGIPEEQLQSVFEPFHTTKGGHHAGLGLAICRETMQALGGEIQVASRPGKGTVFTLTFPLEAPDPGARPLERVGEAT